MNQTWHVATVETGYIKHRQVVSLDYSK